MNPKAAYDMLDNVLAQISMSRRDHIETQGALNFLYQRAKDVEEDKKEPEKKPEKKEKK